MTEPKLARLFHRMATGLQIAQNEEEEMRFMTLTTAKIKVKKRNGEERTIRESFQLLRQRIKWAKLAKTGFQGFKFNRYYCLRTEEGNGVLHIVFWGKYIPIDWLRKTWYEIHGATQADVRMVSTKKKRVNGLVGYLLDRYLMKQKVKRMSYGWRWAWLGFCKSWKNVKQTYGMMAKGRGELGRTIHKKAADALYTTRHADEFGKAISNQSITAWHCNLWGHQVTCPQKKLAGSKTLKWYEPDIPKTREEPKTEGVAGEQYWRCTQGGVRWRPTSFQSGIDDPTYRQEPEPDFVIPPVAIDPYGDYEAFANSFTEGKT